MPNLDHTGPKGQGPKTGKKKGDCSKTDEEKKEGEHNESQGKNHKKGKGKNKKS